MKKILLISLLIPFLISPKLTSAFSLEIPNSKVPELLGLIESNLQFSCSNTQEIQKGEFICEKQNFNKAICYLEPNLPLETKNTIHCAIKNKDGKTLNSLKINKKNTKKIKNKLAHTQSFTREHEFYKKKLQENTYSCEISSTATILSTLENRNITEDELINKIEKDWFGKKAIFENGKWIWGNPNNGFVGHIDTDENGNEASQRRRTGYGVYEKPIAKLYKDYGYDTKIINDNDYSLVYSQSDHLKELLTNFKNGNYVQFWGDVCTDPLYDDGELNLYEITQNDIDGGKNAKNNCWSWGTDRKLEWFFLDNGKLKKHTGLIGEHNFYLLGFTGTIDDPKTIKLWDTATGSHDYPMKEFFRKWNAVKNRSIIIYNN